MPSSSPVYSSPYAQSLYSVAFAASKDVAAMADIYKISHPDVEIETLKTVLESRIGNGTRGILKLNANGKTAGFLGYDAEAEFCKITHLYTQDKRQGAGRALLDAFFQLAQETGKKKVTVVSSDDAVGFYEYMGFAMKGCDGEMKIGTYLKRHGLRPS